MRINSPYITGSATITGNLCVNGTIFGTITGVASTASYALNAETLDGLDSTQFVQTGSFNSYTSSASSSVGDLSGSIATTTLNLSSSVSSSIGSLSGSIATTTLGLSSSVSSSIGSLSGSIATTTSNLSNSIGGLSSSVDTTILNLSSSVSSSIGSLSGSVATTTSGLASRITTIEGRGATTGSNTFIGTQVITGSLFISSDLIVQGSSSLQNITASAVNIGANIVNLNTANPAIRFAGMSIFDSGSIGGSGSFLYDAVQDEFIFVHRGDGTNITSSVVLMGPQTYNNIGSEIYPTNNRLLKGTGNEHVGDSIVSETGGGIGVSGSLSVTGSMLINGGNDLVFRDTSNYISSPATDTLRIVTSNSERIRIVSTGISCFACQVCVPRLQVFNTNSIVVIEGTATNGEGTLTIAGKNSSGTSRSAVFKYDNADVIRVGTANDIPMRFETSDVTRMTISSTGISTFTCQVCAPSFVGGASSGTCAIFNTLTAGNTSGASVNITTNGNNGTSASPLQTNLNFRGLNNNLNGQIRVDDISGTAQVASMQFYTWNSAQVPALTLSHTGVASFANSVCAPSSHLNSSNIGTLFLGTTPGSSQFAARITGTCSSAYNATGKLGFSVTTWGVNTDYGLTEVMAIDMRNADNKNPVIWMNPFGGCVGVGTICPNTILHTTIQTCWATNGTVACSYPVATFSQCDCAGGARGLQIGVPTGGVNSPVFLKVNNTSARFAILDQSNCENFTISGVRVGIGTTTPCARLETVGSGFILRGGWGLFCVGYTDDGLFSTNAAPNFLSTNAYGGTFSKFGDSSGLILGYQDNGAGLYSPAYGFEVRSTDGRPVTGNVVKAIVMRDTDTNQQPFWVNNNGSAYFARCIGIGCTSPTAALTIRCDASSQSAIMEIATCFQNAYRYASINAGAGISYCIPGGTSQSPFIEVQGGDGSVGGGAFRVRTGAMGSVSDKLYIFQNGVSCFSNIVCAGSFSTSGFMRAHNSMRTFNIQKNLDERLSNSNYFRIASTSGGGFQVIVHSFSQNVGVGWSQSQIFHAVSAPYWGGWVGSSGAVSTIGDGSGVISSAVIGQDGTITFRVSTGNNGTNTQGTINSFIEVNAFNIDGITLTAL